MRFMGLFVCVAVACVIAAYLSGRNFWWHRASARFLSVLMVAWVVIVCVVTSRNGTRTADLYLMFGVPCAVYAGAILLRWILAPTGDRPPIVSLRLGGFLAAELWRAFTQWSARFSVSHLR